jgi:hypothetical protein
MRDQRQHLASACGEEIRTSRNCAALRLPTTVAGQSRVLMHYSPGSFLLEAILTLAGLAFTAGLLLRTKYSRASS